MSELKATSGPWFVYSDDEVRQVNGSIVVVPDSGEFSEGVYEDCVAERFERKANAHLIAAAPELYESLVWAMRFVDQVRIESPLPKGSGEDIAYRHAMEALSKSRGEQ